MNFPKVEYFLPKSGLVLGTKLRFEYDWNIGIDVKLIIA